MGRNVNAEWQHRHNDKWHCKRGNFCNCGTGLYEICCILRGIAWMQAVLHGALYVCLQVSGLRV